MGLTSQNSGKKLLRRKQSKESDETIKVALVGNPNVGKSTIFNSLTGSRQHTGNWSGKTVELAFGIAISASRKYEIVDLPGTYSLYAHSKEEEVAGEYILSGRADVTVVVCDSTNLQRSISLLFQIQEITNKVVAVFNLYDEAKRLGINVDAAFARELLGIPVVLTSSKDKGSTARIHEAIEECIASKSDAKQIRKIYPPKIEKAISLLSEELGDLGGRERFLSIALLSLKDSDLLLTSAGLNCTEKCQIIAKSKDICKLLFADYENNDSISEIISLSLLKQSEEISKKISGAKRNRNLSRFDKIITGKWTAFPIMLVLLLQASFPKAL